MISPRFDYPTLTALADYVSEQLLPEAGAAAPAVVAPSRAAPKAVSGESEHLAVLGGACHLPGRWENEWKMGGVGMFLNKTLHFDGDKLV
jgi:hypothetical protein